MIRIIILNLCPQWHFESSSPSGRTATTSRRLANRLPTRLSLLVMIIVPFERRGKYSQIAVNRSSPVDASTELAQKNMSIVGIIDYQQQCAVCFVT
jgi:hypothetical protein